MVLITLRELLVEDKDRILSWRNLPHVHRYMYTERTITPEEHDRWFAGVRSDATKKYWVICSDDVGIGIANLYDISHQHKRCSWAFYLASEDVRGKGIGGCVEYLVMSHVFDEQLLNKLCCEVFLANEAVWQMHMRFGFQREALYRQHIFKDGQFHDVVALAILRDDWLAIRESIRARLMQRHLI